MDRTICLTCCWVYPESYSHVAMRQIRRLDLVWQVGEIDIYEQLKTEAHALEKEILLFVKEIIEKEVRRKRA